jgi:hypothetical protein
MAQHAQHTPGPLNCCPAGCTPDLARCEEGLALFGHLQVALAPMQALAFYNRPANERRALWSAWNTQANQYMAHCNAGLPPSDDALVPQDEQCQRGCERCLTTTRWVMRLVGGKTVLCCSQCHELERQAVAVLLQKLAWAADWPGNPVARSIYTQVRGWIEQEWLLGWRLDNRFEEWQMGFAPGTWEWAAYSRYYGVFLADSGEPYTPPAGGKNALRYHWGTVLVVLGERVAASAAAALRIEENNVDVRRLAYGGGALPSGAPTDYARYSLGPALVERLASEEMRGRIAALAAREGEAFLAWFDRLPEQLVACYRYTLPGGSRLLSVQCGLGVDYHLLLADTDAASDDPHWRARFPAQAFA